MSLYRDFAASRRRKATQGCYSVALHTLMRYEPKVEYMLIQEIDYSLLRRYLNWLYGQDYSLGTISNYIFCIHAVRGAHQRAQSRAHLITYNTMHCKGIGRT